MSRNDNSVVDWTTLSVAEVTGGPIEYKWLNKGKKIFIIQQKLKILLKFLDIYQLCAVYKIAQFTFVPVCFCLLIEKLGY